MIKRAFTIKNRSGELAAMEQSVRVSMCSEPRRQTIHWTMFKLPGDGVYRGGTLGAGVAISRFRSGLAPTSLPDRIQNALGLLSYAIWLRSRLECSRIAALVRRRCASWKKMSGQVYLEDGLVRTRD